MTDQDAVPPGYKRTEIGVIPEDWDANTLSDVSNVRTGPFGSTLHERDYVDFGTPIITVEHLSEYGIIHENLPLVSDSDKLRLKSYSLRENDIVFSRVGSVDRNSLVTASEEGWLFSGRLLRVRVSNNIVHPPYLSYYFHSEPFKNRIRGVAVGQTMASLNTQILNDIQVVIPPFPEQHAIAAALSDVDGLIGALDALIAKKRDMKQAAMQQLLTGRTRLPGFEGERKLPGDDLSDGAHSATYGVPPGYKRTEVGVIPEDWEMKYIHSFTDCNAGGTPSTQRHDYWGGTIRWMNSGELNIKRVHEVEGRITKEGLKNSSTKIIPPKSVLIGLAGQGKTRGTIAMNMVELCTNQSIAAILPNCSFNVDYLYYNLDNRYLELRSMSTGDGGRGGLNLHIIRSILIPFPYLPEQTAIATVLSDMDAGIAALERRRDKVREIKQGMMQQLLTGKVRLAC